MPRRVLQTLLSVSMQEMIAAESRGLLPVLLFRKKGTREMNYSSQMFSVELEGLLAAGDPIDYVQIASWAYVTRLKNLESIDHNVSDWLLQLGAMDFGPEFEFTREQLQELISVARSPI